MQNAVSAEIICCKEGGITSNLSKKKNFYEIWKKNCIQLLLMFWGPTFSQGGKYLMQQRIHLNIITSQLGLESAKLSRIPCLSKWKVPGGATWSPNFWTNPWTNDHGQVDLENKEF